MKDGEKNSEDLLEAGSATQYNYFSAYKRTSTHVDIYYLGEISVNLTNQFINFIANEVSRFETFDFFIYSIGGDASQVQSLITILKRHGLKRFIAYGNCSSAALAILLQAHERGIDTYIDPLTQCVVHQVMSTVTESRAKHIKAMVPFLEEFEKKFSKINNVVLKKILSAKEMEFFHSGNDVYFLGEKLKKVGIKMFDDKTPYEESEMLEEQEIDGDTLKEMLGLQIEVEQ